MTATPNDAVLRQQIYFEGVKNSEAEYGNEIVAAAFGLVSKQVNALGIVHMYELTKTQFAALLTTLRRKLKDMFGGFRTSVIKRVKTVMVAEYQVTRAIFQAVMDGEKLTLPRQTVASLWASIKNDRIAGTGETPEAAVDTYFSSTNAAILGAVATAYASRLSVNDLMTSLRGLAASDYKTGLMHKMFRQYGAMAETVLAHVSSSIMQLIGRTVSKTYIWISILDGVTTDICRSRNGNVYEYGKGPTPPAHYRCRSKTRPYLVSAPTVPKTFWGWLTAQPRAFIADAFGVSTANGITSGKIKSADMPKYENRLRLSPDEYKSKVATIIK